jgi:hypothetical protein
MTKLVIIEHPWKDLDPTTRTAYLKAIIQDTILSGEAAIGSVPTYVLTQALDDLQPDERKTGIALGLEWYRVAEKCVAYVDHGISAGMQMGMAAAQKAGVPVEVRELYPREPQPEDKEYVA